MVRNFIKFLDTLELQREEIVIVRNNLGVARLIPGADLYRTLPEAAAAKWVADTRHGKDTTLDTELRDLWGTWSTPIVRLVTAAV